MFKTVETADCWFEFPAWLSFVAMATLQCWTISPLHPSKWSEVEVNWTELEWKERKGRNRLSIVKSLINNWLLSTITVTLIELIGSQLRCVVAVFHFTASIWNLFLRNWIRFPPQIELIQFNRLHAEFRTIENHEFTWYSMIEYICTNIIWLNDWN